MATLFVYAMPVAGGVGYRVVLGYPPTHPVKDLRFSTQFHIHTFANSAV